MQRAGLGTAADDELTVYAQSHGAALITHDKEFSQRRRRTVIGQHIWLRCVEWDAADLLVANLDELEPMLKRHRDLWVRLAKDAQMEASWVWDP